MTDASEAEYIRVKTIIKQFKKNDCHNIVIEMDHGFSEHYRYLRDRLISKNYLVNINNGYLLIYWH